MLCFDPSIMTLTKEVLSFVIQSYTIKFPFSNESVEQHPIDEREKEQFDKIKRFLEKLKTRKYQNIEEQIIKILDLKKAKSADELLTIGNITASFVLGKVGEKVLISGRSIGDINVQVILEKLGGGGHITLAGAQIANKTIEEVKKDLIQKIDEYFEENK